MLCVVELLHPMLGGDQAVGKVSVIGKEKKTFRIFVQTSHGTQIPMLRRQVFHDRLMLPISQGGNTACRLVEQKHTAIWPRSEENTVT
jgi:hypothetical protein